MKNPAYNAFLLVSQFSVTGALYTCWPDLVGVVIALPLLVIDDAGARGPRNPGIGRAKGGTAHRRNAAPGGLEGGPKGTRRRRESPKN